MISEASKSKGSAVRKKKKTTRTGSSLRKKAPKTTAKKQSVKKTKTDKKPKRKGFVAPKILSIYDMHPMRKYIELLVYNCYSDRDINFSIGLGINYLDSVKVSKTELKTRIKLKKEILGVKKYISAKIMQENVPDQKVLMWDYLKNVELPTSIDLKYHFIPDCVVNLMMTGQQRKVIEGYSALGVSPEEIAETLNRNQALLKVTAEEIEVYQYFYWNLDSSGILPVYPVQVLSDYILRTKAEALSNYRIIIEQLREKEVLDDDMEASLKGMTYINIPYYGSDNKDQYKLWQNIVNNDKRIPLDTYAAVVAVSNGDISPARLNRMVEVNEYSALSFDQQVQEISQKIVNATEAAAEDSIDRAIYLISKGMLPLAQTMLLWNINSKSADRNLGNTTEVRSAKVSDLKRIKGKKFVIDPEKDVAQYQKDNLSKDAEEASFSDIPIDETAGRS